MDIDQVRRNNLVRLIREARLAASLATTPDTRAAFERVERDARVRYLHLLADRYDRQARHQPELVHIAAFYRAQAARLLPH